MKKYIRIIFLSIILLITTCLLHGQQNKEKCCENESCRVKAQTLAVRITGIVGFLGKCADGDKAANLLTLERLKTNNKSVYDDFWGTTKAIIFLINDDRFRNDACFENSLPADLAEKSNIMCWIGFVNDSITKPSFPSAEFCKGWKKRFEIAQGASSFLNKKDMAYLGTIRGYLIYTFRKNNLDECGGGVRLMAGPAFYLRDRVSYVALSSRVAFRMKDIKADPKHDLFPLGNLNLFGEYTTSFGQFNYAGLGIEIELGPFGVNLTVNHNLENGKQGFLVGVVFSNRKFSKK